MRGTSMHDFVNGQRPRKGVVHDTLVSINPSGLRSASRLEVDITDADAAQVAQDSRGVGTNHGLDYLEG